MSDDLMTTSTTDTSTPAIPDHFDGVLDGWLLDESVKACTGSGKGQGEVREILRREVAAHAREIAGPTPNAIEASLAKTIAVAWLTLRHREGAAVTGKDLSLRVIEHRWKLLDRATRRYCMLLRTLAAVRRAGLPAVQVNIEGGTNQTNIGIPSTRDV